MSGPKEPITNMDSKLPDDEAPPPPYTLAPDDTTTHNGHHPDANPLTSHLQHHTTSLPERIRATQEAHTVQQTFNDASLLDHLVPSIEEFLADLGARHTAPPLSTLTLVPEAAVPRNAVLSGMEEMRQRGEACQVSRVRVGYGTKDTKHASGFENDQSSGSDQRWAAGQEFSDWGRFGDSTSAGGTATSDRVLWWRDEGMARRLAGYLQPKIEKREPVEVISPVQAAVEQRLPPQKEKKGWGWGKRRNDSVVSTPPSTPSSSVGTSTSEKSTTATPRVHGHLQAQSDKARMTVTAEEVAFRRENEFGLLESVSGWAVVVAVAVRT